MKHLRRICAGFFLVLALSVPAFAGETQFPGAKNGPTETPGIAGEIGSPGIAGELQTPGVAGEISTPGVAGDVQFPGALGDILTPGFNLIFAIF